MYSAYIDLVAECQKWLRNVAYVKTSVCLSVNISLVNTITQQILGAVKFEDGWPWPIFEVTGVNLNMKICNFRL